MVSEVIISRLKINIGKKGEFFQISTGWRYEGKILDCDDEWLIILDIKGKEKCIKLVDLNEVNIYNGS